jgi:hypothetical protein
VFLAGLWLLVPAFLAYRHDPYWTVVAWALIGALAYIWRVRHWVAQSFIAKIERNPIWIAVLIGFFLMITAESTAVESAIYLVAIART